MILDLASHLHVEAEPRYWEDATVNGVEDEDGSLIPFRDGDLWSFRIELATGKVCNWPEGVTARIHYKVCDAGHYWLAHENGTRLARWSGHYVPGQFLCHGDQGYGDYIILTIDGDGQIASYDRPRIEPEDWDLLIRVEDTDAARDILAERARQITAENWTPEHDDTHHRGEMADAACCYLLNLNKPQGVARRLIKEVLSYLWPWAPEWWKPTDRRRDLVKVGALVLAEIERLDRAAARKEDDAA